MILRLSANWLLRRLQPSHWVQVLRMSRFDPGQRARMEAAQWLAAEYYAKEDTERFLATVPAARSMGGVSLPTILYANHILGQGKTRAKDAVVLYEELIRDQSKRLATGRRHGNPEERRNTEMTMLSLALLHCNLASAIVAADGTLAAVDGALDAAVRYQPRSRYVREAIGREYLRRKEWSLACAAYRDAWRLSSDPDRDALYASAVANVRVAQAVDLEKDGQLDTAISLLEDHLLEKQGRLDTALDFQSESFAGVAEDWDGRIQLQLARLYVAQGRADEAASAYRSSATAYEDAKDYSSASSVRCFFADYLLDGRREHEALEVCDAALTTLMYVKEPSPEQRRLQCDLMARAGLLRLALGEPDAKSQLDEWRRLASAISRWGSYSTVITNMHTLAAQPQVAGALRGYLDTELRHAIPEEEARDLVEGMRSLWKDDLWDEPDGKAPSAVEMLSVMTPIALEIETAVLDSLGSQAILDAFQRLVRESLEQRYGVRIPGMRLRPLDDAAPGQYQVLIHETRRETGTLRLNSVAAVSTATARVPGLTGDPVMNGLLQDWYWIPATAADGARHAGLDVRSPLELLMHHVEHTLAANLVEFLAHQEVQNLLESHKLMKPGESHKIVTMEAAHHMGPLTKVLRALAAERVPLVDFRAIYQRHSERWAAGASAAEIVEDVRQMDAVRDALWGNDGRHALWMLGASLEAELERHLAARQVGAVLMTRQEREALLAPVRERLGGKTGVALVVPRQRQRAFARALVAKEFPHLPVLSRRELRTGFDTRVAGTLELRDSKPARAAKPA